LARWGNASGIRPGKNQGRKARPILSPRLTTQIKQNYFQKLACFSTPENHHPTHHNYHAIHHKLTTKTPPLRTAFSKTTLKNSSKTGGFSPAATPNLFSEKSNGILAKI
jgi:hypothetical protein